MKRISAIALFSSSISLIAFGLVGCNSGDVSTSSSPTAPQSTPNAINAPPMTGGQTGSGESAPAHPPMTSSATEEPLDIKPVKEAQAAYDKAKKASLAAPKDDKATQAYVSATNTLADSTMMGDGLPNVKYPGALKLYREVLKADPANSHAKKEIKQMEDIYASLGKPVPGGK